MNNDQQHNSTEDKIKIWLEEYKALTADIQSRVVLQQTLMNYLLLVVSASAVIFSGLLKDELYNEYRDGLQIFLLFLPMLFSFFVWRHANHDLNIIDKASYINKVIRPNLVVLTGDANLIGWDRYLENKRQERRKYGILMLLSGEHSFHILFSFIALVAGIIAFVDGPGGMRLFKTLQEFFVFTLVDLMLLADILLFIFTIKLKIRIGYAYSTIVNESRDIWC